MVLAPYSLVHGWAMRDWRPATLKFMPASPWNAKMEEYKYCNRFLARDKNGMEETSPKGTRKTLLKLLAVAVSLAAVSASGWFYYYSRLQDVPPPPEMRPQRVRAGARIQLTPQASNTPNADPLAEPPTPPNQAPESPPFYTTLKPMQRYRLSLNK